MLYISELCEVKSTFPSHFELSRPRKHLNTMFNRCFPPPIFFFELCVATTGTGRLHPPSGLPNIHPPAHASLHEALSPC